mgnify:CR=1 FL=1
MRRQTINEASERYGSRFVSHNSRHIASVIALHYGYASSEVTHPLMVRVYNRKINQMQKIPFTDVLTLIPVQPVELRHTEFGQVILSDTVYISTNIYACITAVLTVIGIITET